jgi:hypothetical protein
VAKAAEDLAAVVAKAAEDQAAVVAKAALSQIYLTQAPKLNANKSNHGLHRLDMPARDYLC